MLNSQYKKITPRDKAFWDEIKKKKYNNLPLGKGPVSQVYYSSHSSINDGKNTYTSSYDGFKECQGSKYTRKEKTKNDSFYEEKDMNNDKMINHNLNSDINTTLNNWKEETIFINNETPISKRFFNNKLKYLLDYGFSNDESLKALENNDGDENKALKDLVIENRRKIIDTFNDNIRELISFGYTYDEAYQGLTESNNNFF